MRTILLFTAIFIAQFSFSQMLSGTLVNENRKLVSEVDYTQSGSVDGWAKYELAVNREGEVTSARLIETNLKRTSAKIQLHNYVMKIKFEKGTRFPEFHHVVMKFTLVKPI